MSSTAALERLEPEWLSLWMRCADATPFQSPAWLIPWWRNIGEGHLWTVTMGDASRLTAIAPLYVYTQPAEGTRDVLLVGCGTSDYLDLVCEVASAQDVMRVLVDELARTQAHWDRCVFSQLRSHSPLLAAATPASWHDERGTAEPCAVLDLSHGDGSLESVVPRRMFQNVRYYRRRAERLGPVRFECATLESVDTCFDELLRLHALRWRAAGSRGVLDDARVQRMHREALPRLLASGMLRLYVLRVDERAAACLYVIADPRRHGSHYYYIGAFDPDLRDVSPGTLLIAHAIEQALRAGAEAFDFLRGDEEYKYLWGACERPTFQRVLCAPAAR